MNDLYECNIILSINMATYTDNDAQADHEFFVQSKEKLEELGLGGVNTTESFRLGTIDASNNVSLPEQDILDAVQGRLPQGFSVGIRQSSDYWWVNEPPPPHVVWYSSFQVMKNDQWVEVASSTSPDRFGHVVAIVTFKIL